ncbi:MAG: hypothetical protein JXR76_15255 [Deltaproteobacteria bacterium]|nr:hypothetical protein [Deltaproteobacteria bacterium]
MDLLFRLCVCFSCTHVAVNDTGEKGAANSDSDSDGDSDGDGDGDSDSDVDKHECDGADVDCFEDCWKCAVSVPWPSTTVLSNLHGG